MHKSQNQIISSSWLSRLFDISKIIFSKKLYLLTATDFTKNPYLKVHKGLNT